MIITFGIVHGFSVKSISVSMVSSHQHYVKFLSFTAVDFDLCNPIQWWMGWQAQFPSLFCLTHDILCIPGKGLLDSTVFFFQHLLIQCPGSAVAAERIFLGSRYTSTVSLHHATLHADTIRILILVKKRLHLAHAKANAALGASD